MERDGKNFKTLFYGNFGSRRVYKKRWIKAQVRPEAKDSSGGTTYKSGWHVFNEITVAQKYMKRFRDTRNDSLCVVKCYIGATWKKPTNSEVYLAEKIYIVGEV